MPSGKALFLVAGMAVVAAGLAGRPAAAGSLVSIRRNALVTVGGEVMADIVYRGGGARDSIRAIELRRTDLRLVAEAHPNVRGFFRLNLSDGGDYGSDRQILEEAMLVADSLGGTGLGVFVGQGRAPYGQDVTLGMIQSYNHRANRIDSPEGWIHIIDPPRDPSLAPAGRELPPLRPGQLDRAVMAGASYEWDERWRVEAAIFDPDGADERLRLLDAGSSSSVVGGLGAAARVWWRPVETLTLEASGVLTHSSSLGKPGNRVDLPSSARTRADAWSLSLGFDWRDGPWRVFGEFQYARDWGFVRDRDVVTGQLGVSREFLGAWRLGAMAEALRASGPPVGGMEDTYFKFVLNLRHSFPSGVFIMVEYGHETMRHAVGGSVREKRRGNFVGARMGFLF